MNRVFGALLIVVTAFVVAAAVYVFAREDPVPEAGQTPGYSDPAGPTTPSTPTPASPATTASPSSSTTPSPVRVVFLGDDYTLGKGAATPAQGFAKFLGSRLGISETIVASDGAGYAKKAPGGSNYTDLLDKVVAAKPDVVVVTGGRNDLDDDVATLQAAAESLFTALHEQLPDAKLVAVKPFYGDSPHPDRLGAVDAAIKDAVTAAGGRYLDIEDPLAGQSTWMHDATDPNAKGYRAIAAALAPKLSAVLAG